MNLEALIAMWGQSHGGFEYSSRSLEEQAPARDFGEILDAASDSEDSVQAAGPQFLERALDAYSQRINRGEVNSQPIQELFFPKLARAFGGQAEARLSSSDANDSQNPKGEDEPGAFVIVLARPSGAEMFDEDQHEKRKPGAAVTGAFTGRRSSRESQSNRNETASDSDVGRMAASDAPGGYVPLVQVDDSSVPTVLDNLLGGAGSRDGRDLSGEPGGNQQGIDALATADAPSMAPVPDSIGELQKLPGELTSVTGDHEWESLVFVPMTAFASGHLENQTIHHSAPLDYGSVAQLMRSHPAATPSVGQTAPPVTQLTSFSQRLAAEGSLLAMTSAPTTPTPVRESGVAAVLRRDFYETIQGVLPPRQNFLLLQLGEEKRLFVRDFYSPTDTLRQLEQIAKSSPFDLSELHVVINGVDHGRLR